MIPYHKPILLTLLDQSRIFVDIEHMLLNGQLSNGKYVERLENNIHQYHEATYVIATSSCTQALNICLDYFSNRLYKGYLQLPAFIWGSIHTVAKYHFNHIVWNDINKDTWLPNAGYTNNSLYLHTFGNIGQRGTINNEDTIYDGSHCLGAKFKDIGLATCISLAPTKLITSMEGGLILTNNQEFAEYATEYRDKCCRMSEVNAIFGFHYLSKIERILAWKKRLYETYKKHIPGQFQEIPNNSNYNTIGFLNTEKLKIPDDIETKQYYVPLKKGLKNTDFVYENMVCLPSWYNCPFSEIIDKIKELNGL